jgi:hypothetical protein
MKFSTLITSFIACGSIASTPIKGLPQNIDIHNYIKAEQVYDQVQLIAKIPKDVFIKQVNDGINKAEKALEVGVDIVERLDQMDAQQKNNLSSFWLYLVDWYKRTIPENPERAIKYVPSDLETALGIVYKENPQKVIEGFRKHIFGN